MHGARRGFTIVESAIAAALMMMLVGIGFGVFFQTPADEVQLGRKLDLYSDARRAYFGMTEELKLGTELLQPSISGTTPFILFTNVSYEIIGYYLQQSATDPKKRELCRVNFNDPNPKAEVLSSKVSELKFTRKGRREVAVRLVFQDESGEGTKREREDVMALVDSITLRNTLNAM
jgi:hypothetical protein